MIRIVELLLQIPSLLLVCIGLSTNCYVSGQSILGSDPDCFLPLPLGSPQFAQLCRAEQDLPLLEGLSANQLCDADCRCTHGATARGGRCGTSPLDGETYCICDMGRSPAIPVSLSDAGLLLPLVLLNELSDTGCLGGLFPLITGLCDGGIPLVGSLLLDLCANDCICSHGLSRRGNHVCSTFNGDPNNTINYCICDTQTR